MSTSTVESTRLANADGAVVIRMNRPEKRNALTEADMHVLSQRLHECHHDPSVRAVVLTGAGNAFTSGQDVNDINSKSGTDLAALFERDADILMRIVTMPKPVIAAVNGVSAGFGNHLAICSDYCMVAASAMFHFTGAAKGIPSPMLGTLLLPMVIGMKRAKAIYLRGGKYSPANALADGLCNEVVSDDGWQPALRLIASEFCGRDPQVLALNKHLLNQGAMQMFGALRLSGLAGASLLSNAVGLKTGRVP